MKAGAARARRSSAPPSCTARSAHKRIEIRDALDRLIPDLTGEGVRSADLVIEAVPETLELKRKVYAAIEPKMQPGAILATNTSSIPLEELRDGLQRPDHLVGLHFFNPVSRMQLVEVVSHDQVAPDVLAQARAFLGRIDRLPAPVKSAPGFLVNRALTPYMLEAMVMLDEGIKRETIDAAAEDFGMPMGPIELADHGRPRHLPARGRDAQGRPGAPMPDRRRNGCAKKVETGELGRKTGKGFYEWKDGEAVKDRDAPKPTARDDRPPHPARCSTSASPACARACVADEDTRRRRDDLRDRLRAVPRRPDALRQVARRREYLRRAQATGAALRRALPARSGLGPAGVTGAGATSSPSPRGARPFGRTSKGDGLVALHLFEARCARAQDDGSSLHPIGLT